MNKQNSIIKLLASALSLLAILLALPIGSGIAASAAPDTSLNAPGNGKTDVYYDVPSSFTVLIPGEVALDTTVNIIADGVLLDYGQSLNVSITEINGDPNADNFVIKHEKNPGTLLGYEIKLDPMGANTTYVKGGPLATFVSNGISSVYFSKPTVTPAYAGSYRGTLTFTLDLIG